jgi:hypothetical protein
MRSPLEHSNDWYDLPEIAEKVPLEFLEATWPWFVEQCEEHHSGGTSTVINHYSGYCLSLEDDEGDRPEPGILTSVLIAVDEVAKSFPDEFIRITRSSWSSENAVVHKVLIQGLCLMAPTRAAVGLEYLTGDSRRFQVGTYGSNQLSDSMNLISAIAPRLNKTELSQLESTILSWSSYRPEAQPDGEQLTWDRESRLRLLNAIGPEHLSEQSHKLLDIEKASLVGWDRERRSRARMGFVRQLSPISKEQILTTSDDEILTILEENPTADRSMRQWVEVEGGWEEPGGATAAGQVIAEVAKENPARAMQLILHLVKNGSEEGPTNAVSGYVEEHVSDDEAIAFMEQVAVLNPKSEFLRSNIGFVLYRRCRPGKGLPDTLCKILESWLLEPWTVSEGAQNEEETTTEHEENKEIDSVLWSRGGLTTFNQAVFLLFALTNGYLMRKPAACNEWFDAVDRVIDGPLPARTWKTYCSELRWIRLSGCDKLRGPAIVEKLFRRIPIIRKSTEGMTLIAFIEDLLSLSFIQDFLKTLRESKQFQVRQGFGELLALIALREHHNPWANAELERQLKALANPETFDEAIAIGMAFAASNLWKDTHGREATSQLLCQLIPIANENIANAIETVFWDEETFAIDDPAEQLFRAFVSNPTIFSTMAVAHLVRHLLPFAAHKRELALDICSAILRSRKPDNDLFEAGPDMVKIAMTLQRFSDTRTEGLSLLEDMLRTGLDDAFRVLRDIDIQPADQREYYRPIRPRRARRKYKRQRS